MNKSLLKNSYIVFIITFILLCVIFYLFQIGYSTQIQNGKIVKKFSWKYPLAISLVVWLVWHFYLYPPNDVTKIKTNDAPTAVKQTVYQSPVAFDRPNEISVQKINLSNWN